MFADGLDERCLSPELLLRTPPSTACDSSSTRVQAIQSDLLTIQFANDLDGQPQSLIWSGARSTVRHDVQVSRYGFRGPRFVARLLSLGALLMKYATTLSASLALLNVLPIPKLDGSHMLDALSDLVSAGQASSRRIRRLSMAVKVTTAALAAFSMGGNLILASV